MHATQCFIGNYCDVLCDLEFTIQVFFNFIVNLDKLLLSNPKQRKLILTVVWSEPKV